jgi:hypothetical protein
MSGPAKIRQICTLWPYQTCTRCPLQYVLYCTCTCEQDLARGGERNYTCSYLGIGGIPRFRTLQYTVIVLPSANPIGEIGSGYQLTFMIVIGLCFLLRQKMVQSWGMMVYWLARWLLVRCNVDRNTWNTIQYQNRKWHWIIEQQIVEQNRSNKAET